MTVSVVRPSPSATGALTPLSAADTQIHGGFWGGRLRVNRERTIPHGLEQLRASGAVENLRAAATGGTYRAGADSSGATFPFLDSDVYKWLEAAGWELGRQRDPALESAAAELIDLIADAQRPDGYVNSYVQTRDGVPAQDLAWGHEFYCIGHLIQSAVAWHRAIGDDRLLGIAQRAADWLDREFGPDGRDGIDGHPQIEPGLVELYRVTGERRYLTLAARMIDLRGHGLLGHGRFGPAYWQDHRPVRDATEVAGHVVRQLYLDCGAVDVAVELGDEELLTAVRRRWDDMEQTRTYLTGGLGSRHKDEAFGDPYELPPDRAYAETCAAISHVFLSWRLLLATGDSRYSDVIERTMYNGILAGVSIDGTRFRYVNPLQRRTRRVWEEDRYGERAAWFPCACCPPNVMRTLSSWQQYLATTDPDGVQLHQYAASRVRAAVSAGIVVLSVETAYPWDGRITVRIEESPDHPWTLSLRVPGWARSGEFTAAGESERCVEGGGTVRRRRRWQVGDQATLELDLPIEVVRPHPQVDAVRGCVAVRRGPLVYCLESADLSPGVELEDLEWDPAAGTPQLSSASPFGDSVTTIDLPLRRRSDRPSGGGAMTVPAVPYFAWGHRGTGAMRVWIPRAGL